jgi:aspartate/methionine/tyrosine aminotransferase
MNPLAVELNSVLEGSSAFHLLSGLGRRMFFPRGIISQSAEAKKTAKINATLGMAYEKGKPIMLKAVAERFPGLKGEEVVVYAPTAGNEALRNAWKESLAKKNPTLEGKRFSLPVVVPGITAGISYMADLFLDEGETIVAADPCWGNYNLVFAERRAATVIPVPLFTAAAKPQKKAPGLNLEAFKKAVKEEAKTGKVRIILNFPNNPSGYAPTKSEATALVEILYETAQGGADVLALIDDAYFGLFYEDTTIKESLFAQLCDANERLLAVKIDGPTKEDYVWGLRTAFVTFGAKGMEEARYDALIKKLMGAIRSSVSCANTPAQTLALKAMENAGTAKEKERLFKMMQTRYRTVRRFITENPGPASLEALPFNSGYFMCFRCKGLSAEKLRLALLKKGVGTIALGDSYLRVTFAAIDEGDIAEVYSTIYETAQSL